MEPSEHSDDGGDRDDCEADQQRDAGTGKEAREDVPPELVEAEWVGQRGRLEPPRQLLCDRVVR